MATTDDAARRQTRLTSAILSVSVTDAEVEKARSCLERVIRHSEPWDENERLVTAALRIAAADRSVLSAINNAAQVLMGEALLAAEALLQDATELRGKLGRLPRVSESFRNDLQDRLDYLAEMVEAGPPNDDARNEVREIMELLDGVLPK